MTAVGLDALCGLRMLDARGEFVGVPTHDFAADNPRVVVLRLDGDLYWFQEDPDDGYRSSLSHVRIAVPEDLPSGSLAEFPPRLVSCAVRDKPHHDYGLQLDNVLVGTDEATGTVLFEIGTENIDDYYPCFVSRWTPPRAP